MQMIDENVKGVKCSLLFAAAKCVEHDDDDDFRTCKLQPIYIVIRTLPPHPATTTMAASVIILQPPAYPLLP